MHPLLHLAPLAVCATAALMVAPDTTRAAWGAFGQGRPLRAAGLAAITIIIMSSVAASATPLAAWIARGIT